MLLPAGHYKFFKLALNRWANNWLAGLAKEGNPWLHSQKNIRSSSIIIMSLTIAIMLISGA